MNIEHQSNIPSGGNGSEWQWLGGCGHACGCGLGYCWGLACGYGRWLLSLSCLWSWLWLWLSSRWMAVPMVVCSACGAGAGCACHGAGAALHPFLPGCYSWTLCPGSTHRPPCLTNKKLNELATYLTLNENHNMVFIVWLSSSCLKPSLRHWSNT